MANSSPPNRPIRSPSRSWPRNRSATTRSTRSPARCPWVSLTSLKWSMSMMASEVGDQDPRTRDSSVLASRCQVAAFSSPVLASVRASARSWACMRNRFCMKTTGRATTSAASVNVSANVTSEARQVTTTSVVMASRAEDQGPDPGGGVGQLDRPDDLPMVDHPASGGGQQDGRQQADGVLPGRELAAEQRAEASVELERRGAVGQAVRGDAEHPPVEQVAVDPPLLHGHQRDRGQQHIHRRQQQRDRPGTTLPAGRGSGCRGPA